MYIKLIISTCVQKKKKKKKFVLKLLLSFVSKHCYAKAKCDNFLWLCINDLLMVRVELPSHQIKSELLHPKHK